MTRDYCFFCIAHEMFLHVSDGFISGYALEVKSLQSRFTYKSSQVASNDNRWVWHTH